MGRTGTQRSKQPDRQKGQPPAARTLRWGEATALTDDDDARRRLLAATEECVLRSGTGRISIESVATTAGVARSTIYRYFTNRDDLLLGLLTQRSEAVLQRMLHRIEDPRDAEQSIAGFMDSAIGDVATDPVLSVLFSVDSAGLSGGLAVASSAIADLCITQLGPFFELWQRAGLLAADLDVNETIRWLISVIVLFLTQPVGPTNSADRRQFLGRYVVRALVAETESANDATA